MAQRAVALLSGGLDSRLAIRIVQDFGVEVEALYFRTVFTCCKDDAARAAHQLGVPLTILGQGDEYLELVKRPKYGYGKGANPCVDCRIYMFSLAKRFMHEVGASFMISGELVGQRPMSQKRDDLSTIARGAEADELLLRPLSAKLLPPTLPEKRRWVDRNRLFAFEGRIRVGLIALARQYGFEEIPTPSTGCALTERDFGRKVHDLIRFDPEGKRWDFELLKAGRHFRYDARTKVIVGRNAEQNETLRRMALAPDAHDTTLVEPDNFLGPTVLIVGQPRDDVLRYAGGLVRRYSKNFDPDDARLTCRSGEREWLLRAEADERAELAETL